MVVMHDPVYRYAAGGLHQPGPPALSDVYPTSRLPSSLHHGWLPKGPSKINKAAKLLLMENPFHTFLRVRRTDPALKLALL